MTTLREKMKQEMMLRGFSLGTIKNYIYAVTKLYYYYKKRNLSGLAQSEIKSYLIHLIIDRKLVASSYNVVVHALKFFYSLVLKREIDTLGFPLSKQPKKLPDILSANEVEKIINSVRNIKHRTMLILTYGAGLRASEVVRLKADDIDSERMVLHIRNGKGNKDRYVMLSPLMLNSLRIYWGKCRSKIKCEESWLFPGQTKNTPICTETLAHAFRKAKARAQIRKNGGVHSLRHAFATHASEAGVEVHVIKELLGHSCIQTTTRYLRMTSNKMKSIKPPIESLNIKLNP